MTSVHLILGEYSLRAGGFTTMMRSSDAAAILPQPETVKKEQMSIYVKIDVERLPMRIVI